MATVKTKIDGVWSEVTGNLSFKKRTIQILNSDWTNNTATVSCDIATASNVLIISPVPASYADWGNGKIRATDQIAGYITFTCEEVPTSNIVYVNVVALE